MLVCWSVTCAYVCLCVCVFVSVCVSVCARAYVRACVYVCIGLWLSAHARSRRESLMGSRANPLCRLPAFDVEIH
jgi:hypothetical protein